MRTSISFFPNKTKQSSRTGKIPLYLRIIHNGQKAEARLNEEITEEELFKWNPFVMRLDLRDAPLNSKLNTISKSYDDPLPGILVESLQFLSAGDDIFSYNSNRLIPIIIWSKSIFGCFIFRKLTYMSIRK